MNAEEVELLSDSKYRNYVAAVDKALKNFEYSSEWADLISALGKLNKVMTTNIYLFGYFTYVHFSLEWIHNDHISNLNQICIV